jgi:hypothetical protein
VVTQPQKQQARASVETAVFFVPPRLRSKRRGVGSELPCRAAAAWSLPNQPASMAKARAAVVLYSNAAAASDSCFAASAAAYNAASPIA